MNTLKGNKRQRCLICFKFYSADRGTDIFMACVPANIIRCKKWLKNIGRRDLLQLPIKTLHSKYVCARHFNKSDFKGTRIKKSAIPCQNLTLPPLHDDAFANFPTPLKNTGSIPQDIYKKTVQQHVELDHNYACSVDEHAFSNIVQVVPHGHDYIRLYPTDIPTQPSSNCIFLYHDHDYLSKSSEPDPSPSSSSQPLIINPRKRNYSSSKTSRTTIIHSSTTPDGIVPIKKKKTDESNKSEIQKLKHKIKVCKKQIRDMKKGHFKNIKSLALRSLVQAYLRNQKRKPQGKRYTATDKAIAMAIYKKSPRTYRTLERITKAFPSPRTLQLLLQNMDLQPGISQSIIRHLRNKAVNLNTKEKACVLLFDEMSLKKRLIYNSKKDLVEGYADFGDGIRKPIIADHALVFMIQGVYKKYKQPVAYYFVKGTSSSQNLAALIKKVIETISAIGYEIIATVCDQGPTNIGGLNLLKSFDGIPQESNYFLAAGNKIYIMFDIPHLFKSIRNNFLQGGEIVFGGKKGKWTHLLELEEKNKSTLHFKKITALHVKPKFRSKMKVKLATQILSNTVAAVLKLLSEKYGNTEKGREMLETATIIESLDLLFDCTNGPSSAKDIKKHIRENVSKKSNHHQLWRNFKEKIKTMHFLKSCSSLRLKNVRCVQGYYTSLCSLEDIWRSVESKGFKYLNLRQLNQDALENLFGMIRQHCPTNRNPTCHHFTAALKSNILTRLSTPGSKGANCEEDFNEALIDFEQLFEPVESLEVNNTDSAGPSQACSSVLTENITVLHITEYDDDNDDLGIEKHILESFDKQPTVYVAGYLASIMIKKMKWKCEACTQCLKVDNPNLNSNPVYEYIRLREWWNDKISLTYPTINLCQLVNKATESFEKVKHSLHENNISNYIVTVMLSECDSLLWICDSHRSELLKMLLYRLSCILIRNECNKINQSFATAEETSADIIKKAQQQGTAK